MGVLRHKPRGVANLDPKNIFAGAILGDDWVQMAVIHVDRNGGVYPIRAEKVVFDVPTGMTPSLAEIAKALKHCWEIVNPEGRLFCEQFFLCLPPWGTRSRPVTVRMPIPYDPRIPGFRKPIVRKRHVSELETLAAAANPVKHYSAVDLLLHEYKLENGECLRDPLGRETETLRFNGYQVLMESGVLEALLRSLRRLGITVGLMVSTQSATEGILTGEEKNAGTVIADLDRQRTHCSFYHRGAMRFTLCRDGGTQKVRESAAARLHRSVEDVSLLMQQQEQMMFPDDPNHAVFSTPLFRWGSEHPVLRKLDEAASRSVSEVFHQIDRAINLASREMMLPVRQVVLLGDDRIVLSDLKELTEQEAGVPCRIHSRGRVHHNPGVEVMGASRTFALFRYGAASPVRSQTTLDRHNENALDLLARRVAVAARDFYWSTAQRLADARDERRRRRIGRDAEEAPAFQPRIERLGETQPTRQSRRERPPLPAPTGATALLKQTARMVLQ